MAVTHAGYDPATDRDYEIRHYPSRGIFELWGFDFHSGSVVCGPHRREDTPENLSRLLASVDANWREIE